MSIHYEQALTDRISWCVVPHHESSKRAKGVRLNLPQFDGHFEKEYTINLRGVSNEKEAGIFTRV